MIIFQVTQPPITAPQFNFFALQEKKGPEKNPPPAIGKVVGDYKLVLQALNSFHDAVAKGDFARAQGFAKELNYRCAHSEVLQSNGPFLAKINSLNYDIEKFIPGAKANKGKFNRDVELGKIHANAEEALKIALRVGLNASLLVALETKDKTFANECLDRLYFLENGKDRPKPKKEGEFIAKAPKTNDGIRLPRQIKPISMDELVDSGNFDGAKKIAQANYQNGLGIKQQISPPKMLQKPVEVDLSTASIVPKKLIVQAGFELSDIARMTPFVGTIMIGNDAYIAYKDGRYVACSALAAITLLCAVGDFYSFGKGGSFIGSAARSIFSKEPLRATEGLVSKELAKDVVASGTELVAPLVPKTLKSGGKVAKFGEKIKNKFKKTKALEPEVTEAPPVPKTPTPRAQHYHDRIEKHNESIKTAKDEFDLLAKAKAISKSNPEGKVGKFNLTAKMGKFMYVGGRYGGLYRRKLGAGVAYRGGQVYDFSAHLANKIAINPLDKYVVKPSLYQVKKGINYFINPINKAQKQFDILTPIIHASGVVVGRTTGATDSRTRGIFGDAWSAVPRIKTTTHRAFNEVDKGLDQLVPKFAKASAPVPQQQKTSTFSGLFNARAPYKDVVQSGQGSRHFGKFGTPSALDAPLQLKVEGVAAPIGIDGLGNALFKDKSYSGRKYIIMNGDEIVQKGVIR